MHQGPRPSTEWDVSGDVISSRSGPHGWEVVLGSRGVKRDVRGDVIRRTRLLCKAARDQEQGREGLGGQGTCHSVKGRAQRVKRVGPDHGACPERVQRT